MSKKADIKGVPKTQEDSLDTLVRDLTTVHPMPKSEVRRRLSDFIERAKAERDEEIRQWANAEGFANPSEAGQFAMHADGYNQALEDLINFLSTPQETEPSEIIGKFQGETNKHMPYQIFLSVHFLSMFVLGALLVEFGLSLGQMLVTAALVAITQINMSWYSRFYEQR